ncbi:unnamed protein product [Microthlaspi erraticum]|uniref:CCHC-type domain-containing protein n=1 Tax=Microthlaspi erraticum TaxID=1685480 RepID=A0A6D2KGS5_9BRAS|nr:unnamed protein product [Microthlaspi erraticum]
MPSQPFPKLDRVEAWPVELRNSTGWSSRRSSWSSRWLLPSSFAYPVELLPCAKSLHAPYVPYAPECSKRPISKDQTCICNEYQIPDLNQATEEGTGENEWPQDDEGLNLARRWDEIIATELENLRTEGNVLEQMVSSQRGKPPRRLARMRVPAPSQVTLPCDQCERTGHHSRACPNVRARSRMNERQNICLTCGEKGHFSADCPRNCPSTSQPTRSTTRRETRPGSGSRRMPKTSQRPGWKAQGSGIGRQRSGIHSRGQNEDLGQDRIKNDRAKLKIQQDSPGGTIIVRTWESRPDG